MGMLLILSASGISGLNSCRNVIRGLDFDLTQAPQQAELVASAIALFEPLGERDQDGFWSVDDSPRTVRRLREKLGPLLARAQDRLDEFRRRSDKLPPTR